MSEEKRVRRTPEQIAADLDVQIEKLKDSILELENKKAASVTEFDNNCLLYTSIFIQVPYKDSFIFRRKANSWSSVYLYFLRIHFFSI